MGSADPSYLSGFGFNNRNHTPELIRSIGAFFQSVTPGGVYLMAGTPGHWRTSTSDADRNPEFVKMWTEVFDAISPWTVGRYGNEEEAERWGKERVKADADYLRRIREETGKKVDYIPVVLPGGSVRVTSDRQLPCLSSYCRDIIYPKESGDEMASNAMKDGSYGNRYIMLARQAYAQSMVQCGTSKVLFLHLPQA